MYMPTLANLSNYTVLELQALNQSLTLQNNYWNEKKQQFKRETGLEWNGTRDNYNQWVKWLKQEQLYVEWYNFMFKKFLFEEGYFGELPWWEVWTPTPEWIWKAITVGSVFLLPIMFIIGMVGLFAMFLGPLYCIEKLKEKDYYDAFKLGTVITIIGIALFIAWLWSA
jgi:hypothetical protein